MRRLCCSLVGAAADEVVEVEEMVVAVVVAVVVLGMEGGELVKEMVGVLAMEAAEAEVVLREWWWSEVVLKLS